ncbi:MAG: 2-phosphosulfolactate phosphatase [Sporomusaceae bacterium]|jgi:2-phosphosulfolactate phosphatase|nr:2-phosphosulfolactate phosphatase [Sporomusaceae bacterium]
MDIKILHLLEGAKKALGLAVIIDVFRAFSLECYLMSQGAAQIIPVQEKETAYQLKAANPDHVLVGERGGVMLPGFDYGNSPSQMASAFLKNKTIIHTTSAGTQGLTGAKAAQEVITGSLVNAQAIARYIKQTGFDKISLVCMGLDAKRETEEDTLCAQYLKCLLENKSIDIYREIELLKTTSGSKFFDPAQQDVFPEKDFYLCTEINKFDFILKLEENAYIRKYQI